MLPIARLFGQHGALTALSQAGVPPLRQAPRCPEGVVPLGGEDTPTRGLRDYLRQGDDLFDEPQNLRFVANCRHSFYEVSDSLGGVRNRLVEISDEEPWEGYLEAVTSLSSIRPTLSKTKTCENFAKVGLRLRSC